MITINCAQGSREWEEARLGIPTASAFSRIVTPTGKLSAQREGYLGELLAEWVLGEPIHEFQTEWMERGKLLEPDARAYYAFQRDAEVETVGFIYRDEDRQAGCSPDGLVGDDGLIELKCPMAGKHLVYLSRGVCPKEYVGQVQGQLWVTGRLWCDFMSFHPGLPPFILKVEPDPKFQAALDDHMPTFIAEILEGRERLRELGVMPFAEQEQPEPATVPDIAAMQELWGKK